MPRLKANQVPSYRLHRQSGQAIVTLNGRDILLGAHNSTESRSAYQRYIAEWLANGRQLAAAEELTVTELIARFWKHAEAYYRLPDGSDSSEIESFRQALKPLARLYGPTPAGSFTPLCLKAVREEMLHPQNGKPGWARTYTNHQVCRVRMVFKWAVGNDIVPASVYHGLLAVTGLRAGRTDARETVPVGPVPDAHVAAARVHLSPTLRDMVDLQLCTGMRPGELCNMRSRDIDTTEETWTYKPASHKTAHRGHKRLIYLGPKAQAIIGPRLRPDLSAAIFSPVEAERERHALQRKDRKTKVQPSQILRGKRAKRRKAKRAPREVYDVASYRRAIARACEIAFAMPAEMRAAKGDSAEVKQQKAAERRKWRAQHVWHPHQLRHNAATRLRREFGLEAAQVILGHKTLSVTQVYAEKNVEAARRIMSQIG